MFVDTRHSGEDKGKLIAGFSFPQYTGKIARILFSPPMFLGTLMYKNHSFDTFRHSVCARVSETATQVICTDERVTFVIVAAACGERVHTARRY